ncbi:hypothetical protein Pint_09352 [Pistacia integerrima]|uniref:Uncharacterized protein n=1 Tax=Pistacia integerrima TaxID=434235 RepID=A0ACC0XVE8_9ROSI|nr:hypothetical protein Pint_09352 [Pistacia integerrima]
MPLFDSISPKIGLLNKLVNITITNVNFSGGLPLELANLTSIKVFNISNNVFRGNFSGQIVLGMIQLETLDAYNNNFTGPLPTEIVSLKNLKHLTFGGNYFSGEIPECYSEIQKSTTTPESWSEWDALDTRCFIEPPHRKDSSLIVMCAKEGG